MLSALKFIGKPKRNFGYGKKTFFSKLPAAFSAMSPQFGNVQFHVPPSRAKE